MKGNDKIKSGTKILHDSYNKDNRKMELFEHPTYWSISERIEGEQYPKISVGSKKYIQSKWLESKKGFV